MTDSTNAYALILTVRNDWPGCPDELERKLHRYYLLCCRRIWRLLPQQESRRGVELAEQYLAGRVSAEELMHANYYVEGAAFNIGYNSEPENIERWVREVEAMPRDELRALLADEGSTVAVDARKLLLRAAYFADYAMMYPKLRHKQPLEKYAIFFAPELFRDVFGDLRDAHNKP
jgi:hypothetical protein